MWQVLIAKIHHLTRIHKQSFIKSLAISLSDFVFIMSELGFQCTFDNYISLETLSIVVFISVNVGNNEFFNCPHSVL
jgi:hypothetical protein